MSILSKWRVSRAIDRLSEEKMYQMVNEEMEQGIIRDGLWTKAIAKSGGDDKRTKAHYITLRVQSIIDELEVASALSETAENIKMKTDAPKSSSSDAIQKNGNQEKPNWTCTCGTVNFGSVSNCANCKRYKPQQARW
jgi:hypothetical protein